MSAGALTPRRSRVATAAGGELEQTLSLPGEIAMDADKVAHIVPRVAGIVRRVEKKLGDDVQLDEVMAILESRELAEAKATYLASQQRLSLAAANLKSAEELHAKKIMPDLEFLTIQKAHAEAGIDLTTAEYRLRAIGVDQRQVAGLSAQADDWRDSSCGRRLQGTVIQKHCSPGEFWRRTPMPSCWPISPPCGSTSRCMPRTSPASPWGRTVHLRAESIAGETNATISYVSPVLNESTRAALARADLPNPDRRWRPGCSWTRRWHMLGTGASSGAAGRDPAAGEQLGPVCCGRRRLRGAAGRGGAEQRRSGGDCVGAGAPGAVCREGRLRGQGGYGQGCGES